MDVEVFWTPAVVESAQTLSEKFENVDSIEFEGDGRMVRLNIVDAGEIYIPVASIKIMHTYYTDDDS